MISRLPPTVDGYRWGTAFRQSQCRIWDLSWNIFFFPESVFCQPLQKPHGCRWMAQQTCIQPSRIDTIIGFAHERPRLAFFGPTLGGLRTKQRGICFASLRSGPRQPPGFHGASRCNLRLQWEKWKAISTNTHSLRNRAFWSFAVHQEFLSSWWLIAASVY